ncbi:MAG TPA: dTDP-4-dehydrorhamnose reductase [Vicinamibacterales bacterium]
MRVLVVGAAGQLGRVTTARWSSAGHAVGTLTRAEVDLTNARALEAAVEALAPELILNCAAYNDVDGAEDDPVTALAVNALAVRSLAAVARRIGAVLVHYSTDFVFDGEGRTSPYTEEDQPHPRSVYATSKLLGEWFAAEVPRHYVLRVESLFGGVYARSSVDKLLAGLRAGEPVRVFADRTLTPSYVEDVAGATMRLVETGAPPGLFHCVNSGVTNWLELTEELARLLGREKEAQIVPVSVASVTFRAKRPQYCALSNAKLRALGIEMPEWRDALRRHLAASGETRPGG